jgi:hypothetical protein
MPGAVISGGAGNHGDPNQSLKPDRGPVSWVIQVERDGWQANRDFAGNIE